MLTNFAKSSKQGTFLVLESDLPKSGVSFDRLNLKHSKTVLIFHLDQAVFTCIKIPLLSYLHVTERVFKPLIYK